MADLSVSVIIPVYNGERYVGETLQSVLGQTRPALEVVAVDDGSTDSSATVIRSFPEVRYLHQANQGVAAARNAGLDAAHGSLLTFLDQDDLWPPQKLELQVAYLAEHPKVACVMSWAQFFVTPGVEKPQWVRPELLEEASRGYNLGNMLVRREAFQRVGRFDTRYRLASDHDWFVRAKDADIPMAWMPDVLLQRRVHDANESRRIGAAREMLAIHRASVRRKKARVAQES